MLVSSADVPPTNQNSDLVVATEEMQRANYFAFVMLIKMVQFDERFQRNVTFLMPNDRMLSRITIPQETVADFLLHHSIPSPMLFNHLEHIPTGSMIPSSLQEHMLRISNNGRRNFYVSNVKLISPNICTAASIRCHGVDGVLTTTTNSSSSCPKSSNIPAATTPSPPPSPSPSATTPTPPPPPSPSPSSLVGGLNPPPLLLAQAPTGHYMSLKNSASSPFGGLSIICFTIVSIWGYLSIIVP